jgi:hypothetical protein
MVKFNAPTHEFEKSDFGDRKEYTMFSRINQNEKVLLAQVSHGCE